jgi:hypothetical protein
MKRKYLMLCLLINCTNFGLFAQSSESEISTEFYKADAQLSIVLHYLPAHWAIIADDTSFTLRSSDTVWVLDENRINAPMEKKEIQQERIKKFGKRVFPEIYIRYEAKWTPEQIQMAKITNAAIDGEVRGLPAKFHISLLYDSTASTKFMTVYTPTNEKERKLIEQYQAERERQLQGKVVLPDFHSEKYSLFITKITGAGDEMHLVFPDQPSVDIYTILSTFREVCGK